MWLPYLLLAFFPHTSFAQTANDVPSFQLDALFPQPNGVYRRIDPFPIIFTMSGLETIWQDKPGLFWRLNSFRPWNATGIQDWVLDEGDWWGGSTGLTDMSSDPSANTIIAHGSPYPAAHNKTKLWQIEYKFSQFSVENSSCIVVGPRNESFPYGDVFNRRSYFQGSYNFTIEDDVPPYAFTSDGPCGYPLGTLGVVGHQSFGNHCPIMMNNPPAVQQCRTRLNDTGFSVVRQEIGREIRCGQVNTSIPDFNRTLCRIQSSNAISAHPGAVVAGLAAFTATMFCSLALVIM